MTCLPPLERVNGERKRERKGKKCGMGHLPFELIFWGLLEMYRNDRWKRQSITVRHRCTLQNEKEENLVRGSRSGVMLYM